MVQVGATGRNSGKTTLTVKIIEAYKEQFPIIAFKLITVRDHGDICPRGGKGCGICKGLKGCFDIIEEKNEGDKDTMLYKKAGAEHVYLIRSFVENIREALLEALKLVPEGYLVICESNSARLAVKPGCFVMIDNRSSSGIKPSAQAVIDQADILLKQDTKEFDDFVQNKLKSFLFA
jgi:hypothetical protein